MSRVEENRKLGERRFSGNHETLLNAILYDISKSLAVLADNSNCNDLDELYKKVVEDDRKLWENIMEINKNKNLRMMEKVMEDDGK